jgi:hypothetical protein
MKWITPTGIQTPSPINSQLNFAGYGWKPGSFEAKKQMCMAAKATPKVRLGTPPLHSLLPRNPYTWSSVCRADKCRCPRNPCTFFSLCHADKCRCPRNPCTFSSLCRAGKCRCPRNPYTWSSVCQWPMLTNAAAPAILTRGPLCSSGISSGLCFETKCAARCSTFEIQCFPPFRR